MKSWKLPLVNLLLAVVFLAATATTGHITSPGQFFLSTSDAREYYHLSLGLFGFHDHLGLMEPRPFFYPVLLGLNLVLGEFAVLVSQVLLWFLSGNLIFLGLQRLTGKTSWAIAGLAVYSVNLTLLILTFHALTETVVVFLTSLFVFLTYRGYLVGSSRKQFTLLFVLSLLTVTKPVFGVPPVSWTPNPLGEWRIRCQEQDELIHPSFASR